MGAFFVALVALCTIASILRENRMAGSALILLLNWAVCTAAVESTGEIYPWEMFFVADHLSALAMVAIASIIRPTLWQGIVIALYGVELVCHIGRGLSGSPAAIYYGWYLLKYVSWAQVGVMIGWAGYEMAGRAGMFVRRPSRLHALLGGASARDERAPR